MIYTAYDVHELLEFDLLPEIECEELDVEYLDDSDYESDPADNVRIYWA